MILKELIALATILFISACSNNDKTISIAADDPEMLAAMSKGHETLPDFWKVYENPKNGESDFVLKVRVFDEDQVEYFWMVNLERGNEKLYGEVGNDPEIVTNVKIGQRIEIQEDTIVDWQYRINGKIVGNFTIRPLLKHMSESEAAEYKNMLYEP